jgi:hypothetical protein
LLVCCLFLLFLFWRFLLLPPNLYQGFFSGSSDVFFAGSSVFLPKKLPVNFEKNDSSDSASLGEEVKGEVVEEGAEEEGAEEEDRIRAGAGGTEEEEAGGARGTGEEEAGGEEEAEEDRIRAGGALDLLKNSSNSV